MRGFQAPDRRRARPAAPRRAPLADALDRRKVLVALTDAGETVLAALSRQNLDELRLIAPAFAGLLAQLEALERSRD